MDRTDAPESENGMYVPADEAAGKLGTVITADSMNQLQEEILTPILQSGQQPNRNDTTQLFKSIVELSTSITNELCNYQISDNSTEILIPENALKVNLTLDNEHADLSQTEITVDENFKLGGAAYGNGIRILTSTDTTQYYRSPDGETWEEHFFPGSLCQYNNYYNIHFINGYFFVLVSLGYILHSQDGIQWDVYDSELEYAMCDIVYFKGKFIVSSEGSNNSSNILISSDLQNWSVTNYPYQGARLITDGNIIIRVAYDSPDPIFFISTDGESWTEYNLSSILNSVYVRSSIYYYDRFIFVMADMKMYYSFDGLNWVYMKIFDSLTGKIYRSNNCVFMNLETELAHSTDLISWQNITALSGGFAGIIPGNKSLWLCTAHGRITKFKSSCTVLEGDYSHGMELNVLNKSLSSSYVYLPGGMWLLKQGAHKFFYNKDDNCFMHFTNEDSTGKL